MKKSLLILSVLVSLCIGFVAQAQITIPGDSIVYGPMFSPVYNNSVRVWVLTKSDTGMGENLELSFTNSTSPETEITGTVFNSDTRLGYNLRSYEFTGLTEGDTYTTQLIANGSGVTNRITSITNAQNTLSDFEFLSGGCGRIYDITRCIDQPEAEFHVNGTPTMFNTMAEEGSDLMVWLGDATYLLGLQHAMGQCPDGVDDWANKDMAFDRYLFQRNYHDSLTVAMPQLAITDNHDLGPNEFDKNMPTIGKMREIFMDWWPNPEYLSTPEGQGLYSSYKYKDVEYFLTDNRSYRDNTQQHFGPDQLDWLKQGLLNSTATFKVIVSGTPVFYPIGGRNFSVSTQHDELFDFIQENKINGVLALSADIHEQKFMLRDGDTNYPLIDVLSGNLNSDVGNGNYYVNYGTNTILQGVKQTYLRVNVYGEVQDRRMKVEYVGIDGQPYFEEIIHEDMLTSQNSDAHNLALPIENSIQDTSIHNQSSTASNISFTENRNNEMNEAARFSATSSVEISSSKSLKLHDKAFSLTFWVNPSQVSNKAVIFSNKQNLNGLSFGITSNGNLYYEDHFMQVNKISQFRIAANSWSFITWKYDNVKRVLSLYYNGFLIESWDNVISSRQSFGSLKIGETFEGLLDELNLYGRLISDKEIMDQADIESSRGQAISIPGSQNMSIPGNVINSILQDDFSIQFWAKLNADPGNNHKILASNGRVENNTTGISFEYPDSNKLNIVWGTNTGSWGAISEQGDVWNVGEWNHVTVTAVKNDSIKYYLNGSYVGGNDYGEYIPNSWGLGLGDSPAYGGDVNAEMDELRIWKRALTVSEIEKLIHYPLIGPEQDLALYYDFETFTENTNLLKDKGNEAFDITLDGASLIAATSPVSPIIPDFQNTVVGQWSKNDYVINKGLETIIGINSYINNMIIGKNNSTSMDKVDGYINLHYLKGGWQIDPLNIPYTSFRINLDESLGTSVYDSISKLTQEFYLMEQDTIGSNLIIVADGSLDGNQVEFNDVNIKEAFYYLAWGDNTLFQDQKSLERISLYPNPTSGKVNISGFLNPQDVTVEVYDLLGRTYTVDLKRIQSNSIEIDLSSSLLTNNFLMLKVNQGRHSKTFKILKSN